MTYERAQTPATTAAQLATRGLPACAGALRRLQQHRRGPGQAKRAVVVHLKKATYAPSTCQQTHTALGPGLSQAHTPDNGTNPGEREGCMCSRHSRAQTRPAPPLRPHLGRHCSRGQDATMHAVRTDAHSSPGLIGPANCPAQPTERCGCACSLQHALHSVPQLTAAATMQQTTQTACVCTSLHARTHHSQTPHKLHLYPPLMLLTQDVQMQKRQLITLSLSLLE